MKQANKPNLAPSDAARGEQRQRSPSAERNTLPIIEVLRRALPASGRALELASGTGQHVVAFARSFPAMVWTPSDPHPDARASIRAWVAHTGVSNVSEPLELDVTSADWERTVGFACEAMVCINLLHIAPWTACTGLMRGAGILLRPGGFLYVYGPFKRRGAHTAPSNAEFDASLRYRNAAWGVRDADDVAAEADASGLGLGEIVEMPANNLSLLFHKT